MIVIQVDHASTFFLPLGFTKVAFTQTLYSIPRAPTNNPCVREERSLQLPPPVQLQLNKPATVLVSINLTVKGVDIQCKCCVCIISKLIINLSAIVAVFPVGDTIWTMDHNKLFNMGHSNVQLSIKLPEKSDVDLIISSPYKANAVIGM